MFKTELHRQFSVNEQASLCDWRPGLFTNQSAVYLSLQRNGWSS